MRLLNGQRRLLISLPFCAALLAAVSLGCNRGAVPPKPVTATPTSAASSNKPSLAPAAEVVDQTPAAEVEPTPAVELAANLEATSAVDAAAASVQETAAPEIPGERLLVYTPGGPLILELFVSIDGQPYLATRERMLQELLKAADGDENGEATWEEVWADPRFESMEATRNPSQNDMERDRRRRTYDRNGDGLVNGTEAEQLLSRLVGPPAALQLQRANLRDARSYRSRIRDLLDDDRDGYLSAEECQAAPERLSRRDADRDELVDQNELSEAPAIVDGQQPAMRQMRYDYDIDLPPQADLLDARVLWSSVYVTLRELYLSDGELGAGSFPLMPGLAKQLDLNESRVIDKEEIKRLTRVPSHIQIDLRYGRNPAETAGLSVRSISPELGGVETRPLPDGLGVQISLPGAKLQLRAQDFSPSDDFAAAAKQALEKFDADKNGYLDATEAAENEQFSEEVFKSADADQDGKLYPAEIEKYLGSRQPPSFNRVQVQSTDSDDALFAALDTNGDGRLGPRELRAATKQLLALDLNADGKILADEVTAAVQLSFDRGEAQADGAPRVNRLAPARAAPVDVNLPRWFVGMDRNGDGDLSSREFLGTPAQFGRLDSNSDGFISSEEALNASSGS